MKRALLDCCAGVLVPFTANSTRVALVCGLVAMTAACGAIFGPTYRSQLGYIDQTFPSPISIPDSVAAKTDFTVSFRTSGGGCMKQGDTEVMMIDSRTAEIRPYDDRVVNPTSCTANIEFYSHTATLQFAQSGNATVRLISAYNDSTITITRTVVVR
jgi:hypothetical protein